MYVDYNTVNACPGKVLYDTAQQRLTPYSHQRFWHGVGKWFKACAHSCRKIMACIIDVCI